MKRILSVSWWLMGLVVGAGEPPYIAWDVSTTNQVQTWRLYVARTNWPDVAYAAGGFYFAATTNRLPIPPLAAGQWYATVRAVATNQIYTNAAGVVSTNYVVESDSSNEIGLNKLPGGTNLRTVSILESRDLTIWEELQRVGFSVVETNAGLTRYYRLSPRP